MQCHSNKRKRQQLHRAAHSLQISFECMFELKWSPWLVFKLIKFSAIGFWGYLDGWRWRLRHTRRINIVMKRRNTFFKQWIWLSRNKRLLSKKTLSSQKTGRAISIWSPLSTFSPLFSHPLVYTSVLPSTIPYRTFIVLFITNSFHS